MGSTAEKELNVSNDWNILGTATATKTSLEKRIRAYSISLNSSNVGTIFWELNSKGQY